MIDTGAINVSQESKVSEMMNTSGLVGLGNKVCFGYFVRRPVIEMSGRKLHMDAIAQDFTTSFRRKGDANERWRHSSARQYIAATSQKVEIQTIQDSTRRTRDSLGTDKRHITYQQIAVLGIVVTMRGFKPRKKPLNPSRRLMIDAALNRPFACRISGSDAVPRVCSNVLMTSSGVVTPAAKPPARPPAMQCVVGSYPPEGFINLERDS
jgi:hypothetical protein